MINKFIGVLVSLFVLFGCVSAIDASANDTVDNVISEHVDYNELISVNDLSAENYKVATKVAVLNQSMNKGVKELTDNWETYKDTLKTAQKGT